jgi:hypothetical protein
MYVMIAVYYCDDPWHATLTIRIWFNGDGYGGVIGLAQVFADMGVSNAKIHRQMLLNISSQVFMAEYSCGYRCFPCGSDVTPLVVKFYREPRLYRLLYLTAILYLITPFGQQFQILLQKELSLTGAGKYPRGKPFTNSIIAINSCCVGFRCILFIWAISSGHRRMFCYFSDWRRSWRPDFIFTSRLKGVFELRYLPDG